MPEQRRLCRHVQRRRRYLLCPRCSFEFARAQTDFNSDRHPDYLLFNSGTRRTAVWYLNNNIYWGAPMGQLWRPAGPSTMADFDRDGHPDYVSLSHYPPNCDLVFVGANISPKCFRCYTACRLAIGGEPRLQRRWPPGFRPLQCEHAANSNLVSRQ